MTAVDIETVEIGDECCICFTDFDNETKVLYQDKPDSEWKTAAYCFECTKHMLKSNWQMYKDKVEKADCKRALRGALKSGPPINMRDIGFPCDNDTGEVLKMKCNDSEFSPKLEGSLEGDERNKWWEHYNAIMNAMDEEDKKGEEKMDDTKSEMVIKKELSVTT